MIYYQINNLQIQFTGAGGQDRWSGSSFALLQSAIARGLGLSVPPSAAGRGGSNLQWLTGSAPIGGVADRRTPYAERSVLECPPCTPGAATRSPRSPPSAAAARVLEMWGRRETGEERRQEEGPNKSATRVTRVCACAWALGGGAVWEKLGLWLMGLVGSARKGFCEVQYK